MTYEETITFLYSKLPAFQNMGKKAIRPSFDNILRLCEAMGNPHEKFRTIHVGGTNGKGSSSHMIASALQENGYRTGLYTSPHLKDLRERFKINGEMPSRRFIIEFVENHKQLLEEIEPSFFELTVALAFHYFAVNEVDVAVIEVGLGGRLDSTNIIRPVISLITNIGFDHMDVLGNTLQEIAFEKAGIIKANTPVVISEFNPETEHVFRNQAISQNAPIIFAQDEVSILKNTPKFLVSFKSTREVWDFEPDLKGAYQEKNLAGVCTVLKQLRQLGFKLRADKSMNGLEHAIKNTSLKGRWQKLNDLPLTICDTGHNEHAFRVLVEELKSWKPENCHFILGFSRDKDLSTTLGLLPKNSNYYFVPFQSPRAARVKDLIQFAKINNIINVAELHDVNEAIQHVMKLAREDDFIYIGGSTYLVAEIKDL